MCFTIMWINYVEVNSFFKRKARFQKRENILLLFPLNNRNSIKECWSMLLHPFLNTPKREYWVHTYIGIIIPVCKNSHLHIHTLKHKLTIAHIIYVSKLNVLCWVYAWETHNQWVNRVRNKKFELFQSAYCREISKFDASNRLKIF